MVEDRLRSVLDEVGAAGIAELSSVVNRATWGGISRAGLISVTGTVRAVHQLSGLEPLGVTAYLPSTASCLRRREPLLRRGVNKPALNCFRQHGRVVDGVV